MRDHIGFARLISQISILRGSMLNNYDVRDIATTLDEMAASASSDSVNRLLSAMKDGRKIEAIKEYRSITGMGLKESKDAVEMYSVPVPLPSDLATDAA